MSRKTKYRQAVRRRSALEETLASVITDREHTELEIQRVEKRDPRQDSRVRQLDRKLQELSADLRSQNARVQALRSRRHKATRAVKRLARQLRNRAKPKVHDLGFSGGSGAMGTIVASIGHYTAGALAEDDEQAVRLWRLVDQQHRNQGWAMIGYHIGLGPEGGIYLLRPLRYSGAHTLGYNTGFVGLSVHGTTGDTWTGPQLRALRSALSRFGLQNKPVYGHNDKNATACPGSFKAGYVSKGRSA